MANDILVNESGDIIGWGDSDEQNLSHLILTEKGEVRSHPTMGVGIKSWLNDDDAWGITTQVRRQAEKDGAEVYEVKQKGGQLEIKASYDTTGN